MRATLKIDDKLLAKAQHITGVTGKSELVHEGLKALIERESAKRLAGLGGRQPGLQAISRQRSTAE
ncbi:MAG: type II toxin-antitoxin system VapB family antitoxin [Gammaproteobacteria bacterium]|nr:type II toxin-antitoxin system VapB family antitoxin [Gammaproteobacteria bacterium]